MKASVNWLRRLVDLPETPEEIADHLTAVGLEVEGIERVFQLPGVLVAEIRAAEKVEGTKLSVCRVWNGSEELQIVCGASNARAGIKTALATVGTTLPGGIEIRQAKVRGIESSGMLCASDELGLGEDHSGILELDGALAVGASFAQATGIADAVLEINVTPNRPDATGHLGLARELAARFGRPLRNPLSGDWVATARGLEPAAGQAAPTASGACPVSIAVEPGAGCTRYVGRVIDGVANGASPAWMQSLLRAVGLRPISALVDITNFVLLETGQPLHAFDVARLRGASVVVRGARQGERLTTLDGREHALDAGDLVICDGEGPQCLAGVMGGADSGVEAATTSLFLETACFKPSAIRFLARRRQATSDSSYRFERGVDRLATLAVSDYATRLILSICGGRSSESVDIVTAEHDAAPRRIGMRPARLRSVLGLDLPAERVVALLEGIGFRKAGAESGADLWDVPGWRPDVFGEVDLFEEVARLVGYDAIPAEEALFPMTAARLPAAESLLRRLRRAFAARGLNEALSLRFASRRDYDKLGLAADDPRSALVELLNPLTEELGLLPRLGIVNLLRAASRNESRQERGSRLFECARVFGRDLPEAFAAHRATGIGERLVLSGVVGGLAPRLSWGAEESLDFYRAKGLLQGALRDIGGALDFAPPVATEVFLHPGQSADVLLDGERVGFFGALHPRVLDAFDLRQPYFVWELDLDGILARLASREATLFRKFGDFPSMRREINVLVGKELTAAEVERRIRELPVAWHDSLRDIQLVSVYEGQGVPAGSRALLFRFVYWSFDRTLTDAEINEAQNALRAAVEADPAFELK